MNIVYGDKRDGLSGRAGQAAGRGHRADRSVYVERAADPDVFALVVRHIIGQPISTAAQAAGTGPTPRRCSRSTVRSCRRWA